MLCVTLKDNERVQIGKDITITIKRKKGATRAYITAPKDVRITRLKTAEVQTQNLD